MSDLFAHIVCGVDGSAAGREAVAQARRLATKESELVVVSVSETQVAVHAGMLARKAAGEIEADARAALDQVAAKGVELRLVHGRADDTMLAATEGATLVVVGSHEKPRGRGTLLGSVATRLVHDAPCSVLVTRAADEPERFPQSIAVGVDGSPASLSAAGPRPNLGYDSGQRSRSSRRRGTHPISTRVNWNDRDSPSITATRNLFPHCSKRRRVSTCSSSPAAAFVDFVPSAASVNESRIRQPVRCSSFGCRLRNRHMNVAASALRRCHNATLCRRSKRRVC